MASEDESLASRVFVGHIPQKTEEHELREIFSKYGSIQKINVFRGYAFVQFDSEASANMAIQNEEGNDFKGQKMNVKQAQRNKKAEVKQKDQEPVSQAGVPQEQLEQQQQQQEEQQEEQQALSDWASRYLPLEQEIPVAGSADANAYVTYPTYPYQNHWQNGGKGENIRNSKRNQNQRPAPRRRSPPRRSPPRRRPARSPSPPRRSRRRSRSPPENRSRDNQDDVTNDAEIVCMDKGQRFYAESIESRLVALNMRVDVLFPNPNAPLSKVLANITSRGVVYAIVITPMNEVHSSVTINILQGQQQEHRNMPLDSAMEFIAKSYQNILNLKAKTGMGLGNAPIKPAPGVVPSDIRNIIGFMKEHRAMSVMEYDKLIKFLAQRREEVITKEYGDDVPAHLLEPNLGKPIDPAVKAKQEEVLAKIRRVLHAHGEFDQPPPPTAAQPPPEAPKPPVSTPALAPSLQQALDSLIRTGPNLLMGKSAMTTHSTAPPPSAPTTTYPSAAAPTTTMTYAPTTTTTYPSTAAPTTTATHPSAAAPTTTTYSSTAAPTTTMAYPSAAAPNIAYSSTAAPTTVTYPSAAASNMAYSSAATPRMAYPSATAPRMDYPAGITPQASVPSMAYRPGFAPQTASTPSAPVPTGGTTSSAAPPTATASPMFNPGAALQPRPLFNPQTGGTPFPRGAARLPAVRGGGPHPLAPRVPSLPQAQPRFPGTGAPTLMPYPTAGFTNPLFASANYLPPSRMPGHKGPAEVMNALQRPPPPPPQQTQHRPNAPVRPSLYPYSFSGY